MVPATATDRCWPMSRRSCESCRRWSNAGERTEKKAALSVHRVERIGQRARQAETLKEKKTKESVFGKEMREKAMPELI